MEDPSEVTSITQGIPIELETPNPIGLKVKEGITEVFRVTIFSDACFSGWKRSHLYSINSEGVLELKKSE